MPPLKQEHMILIGIVVVLCVISLVLYISQPWRRRPLAAARPALARPALATPALAAPTAMKKAPMPVAIPRMTPAAAPMRVEPMPPLPRMQPSSVGRRQNHDDMMGPSTMTQSELPDGYHMMPDGRVMKDSDHDIPQMQPSAHPDSPHHTTMGPSTMAHPETHMQHSKAAEHEPVSSDEDKHRMELMRGSTVGRRAMIAPTTSALMMGAINTRENSAERGHGSSAVMDRHLSLPKSNGSSTGHPQPYGGSSSGASTF